MSLLATLKQTIDTLRRNPVLFIPVVFIMLLLVPQLTLRSVSPGLANLFALLVSLAFVFLLPFLQGGLTGMANEALDANTSLTTFFQEGKRNYVSLFAVFLGVVALNIIVGLVMLFVGLFTLIANYPGGAGDTSTLTAVLLITLAVIAVVFLLLVMFTQFYTQAIVIDDQQAFESIKRSIALVRSNLVSVVSYSVVVGSLGVLVSFLFGLSVVVTSNTTGPLTRYLTSVTSSTALIAAVIAIGILSGGIYSTLSVAFYRTLCFAE